MKLLTLDLSSGQPVAVDKIDVDVDGNIDTQGAFETIGVNLVGQGSKPSEVTTGIWLTSGNDLRFYQGSDYQIQHSGVTLGGDLSGNLPSPQVAGLRGDAVFSGISPSDGQVLTWDNGNTRWDASSPIDTLAGLTDTTITSPADAALLLYDTATSKWRDAAMYGDAVIDDVGAITVSTIGGTSPLLTSTSFSGDVSGNYDSTVVADDSHAHTATTLTLGNLKSISDVWDSMSPTDQQVLYWDTSNARWDAKTVAGGVTTLSALSDTDIVVPEQYQTIQWDGTNSWDNDWPAMVNTTSAKTFIVLGSGATAADVNAALLAYQVVYLRPGNYYFVSTLITVPDGKKLIGLGHFQSANPVTLNWSGSTPSRHLLMQNGWIENLILRLTGVAHTTNVVEGHATNDLNVVRRVAVNTATTASIYAFYGEFAEITDFSISLLDGVSLTGTPSSLLGVPGTVRLDRFYIYAAPTNGILLASVSDAVFSNGVIECNSGVTDYGIRGTANTRLKFENVRITEPATTGVDLYTSGNDITLRDIKVFGKTGTTDRGVYISAQNNVVIDNCYAEYCNGTASVGYGGILIAGSSTEVHISGCTTRLCSNTSNAGIYVAAGSVRVTIDGSISYQDYRGLDATTATYVAVNNHIVYDSGNTGVYTDGLNCAFSNIQIYSAGLYGFYASGDRCTYSDIYASQCASYGIYLVAAQSTTATGLGAYACANTGLYINNCDHSSFANLQAFGQTANYGIYLVNCNYTTLTGIDLRDNASHGMRINACDFSAFTSIMTYSNGADGLQITSSDYCVLGDVLSYDNVSEGVYATSNTKFKAGNIAAYNNGSYGIFVSTSSERSHWGNVTGYGNTNTDLYFGPVNGVNNAFLHGSAYGTHTIHGDWNEQVWHAI